MKRDLELIRSLLIAVEAAGPGEHRVPKFVTEGCDIEETAFHLALLADAGFILVRDGGGRQRWDDLRTPQKLTVHRITNQGFDYLDAVRTPERWARVKARLRDEAVAVPLDVVKGLGLKLINEAVGL